MSFAFDRSDARDNPGVIVLPRAGVYWVSRGADLRRGQRLRLGRSPSTYSYEGVGLSVSRHPEAWARIAKIPGPTYRFTRADGVPGRFVRFEPVVAARAYAWGVRHGWLLAREAWAVSYWDDEAGGEMTMVLRSLDEVEAEGYDRADAVAATVYGGTPALAARWAAYFGGFQGERELDVTYAMAEAANLWLAATHPTADGWWWEGPLSVANLQAPRGVILPHAMERWQVAERLPPGPQPGR